MSRPGQRQSATNWAHACRIARSLSLTEVGNYLVIGSKLPRQPHPTLRPVPHRHENSDANVTKKSNSVSIAVATSSHTFFAAWRSAPVDDETDQQSHAHGHGYGRQRLMLYALGKAAHRILT